MQVSAREQRGRLIRALTGEGPGRAGWGRRPRCMPGQNCARDCGFYLKFWCTARVQGKHAESALQRRLAAAVHRVDFRLSSSLAVLSEIDQ